MSLKEICNCVGLNLSGKFSVRKDFFGYQIVPGRLINPNTGTVTPALPLSSTISLLTQMNLLKNNPHIKVHIKVINPVWFTPSGISLDALISSMRSLYGSVGIGIVIKSYEVLNHPEHEYVEVDNCDAGDPSDEQETLFYSYTNFVTILEDPEYYYTYEIVIFLITGIVEEDGKPLAGCASSPWTNKGAVLAEGTNLPWLLAHEIGHNLELSHPAFFAGVTDRLMYRGGPFPMTNPPPDLTNEEVVKMKTSRLMFGHC